MEVPFTRREAAILLTIYSAGCVVYFPILVMAIYNSWAFIYRQQRYKNLSLVMFYFSTFLVIISRYVEFAAGIKNLAETPPNGWSLARNAAYSYASLGKIIMGFFQWYSMISLKDELRKIYGNNQPSKLAQTATLLVAAALSIAYSILIVFVVVDDKLIINR